MYASVYALDQMLKCPQLVDPNVPHHRPVHCELVKDGIVQVDP